MLPLSNSSNYDFFKNYNETEKLIVDLKILRLKYLIFKNKF